MSQQTLAISYFFHLVATVIWLGGLAVLTMMVWPEANRSLQSSPQLYAYMRGLRKRFVPWANFSLAVLVVSGMIQMAGDEYYMGTLDFSNEWSRVMLYKHIAIVGMVICSLALQYGVAPELERTSLLVERDKATPQDWQTLRKREVWLTWANNGLGLLVLLFTAWMTAI